MYALLEKGRDVVRFAFPAEPGGVISSESTGTHNMRFEKLLLFDLARRTSSRITTHGTRLLTGQIDPSGRVIVTGDVDGVVRAGPVTGEEPHLLLGHRGM